MTIVGSLGCLVNAIPAILTGAAAVSTGKNRLSDLLICCLISFFFVKDWNSTSYGMKLDVANSSDVLYISMSAVLPGAVAFICVGALASGLIASCDSAILGAATVVAHNVYKSWLRPTVRANSSREIIVILQYSMLLFLFRLVSEKSFGSVEVPFCLLV